MLCELVRCVPRCSTHPTPLGQSATQAHTRVDELADLTRLPRESLSRYPAQLSDGQRQRQRQRLGIMRALMLDPPLVLLALEY